GAVDAVQAVRSPVLRGDVGAHHQVAHGPQLTTRSGGPSPRTWSASRQRPSHADLVATGSTTAPGAFRSREEWRPGGRLDPPEQLVDRREGADQTDEQQDHGQEEAPGEAERAV